MRKEKLIGRLKTLYSLEFINAFFLPFIFLTYCYVHDESVGLNSLSALTLYGILLLEGSYFWFSVSRQLRTTNLNDLKKTFKRLKTINLVLILIEIMFIIIHPFNGTWDMYGTLLFLSLAVLEHVNYFEFQLMYDNKNDLIYLRQYGRLKKSKLKRILTK